ncbi:hypothetical protein [Aestuariivirga litoralis]|uniref:hypothetical protein n=1 Tax=Aestuariivirga litoralis TaxID=2650924 RepID=UPI0011B5F367|nr:hypothetical protein [Aestuariivirga litoralis]
MSVIAVPALAPLRAAFAKDGSGGGSDKGDDNSGGGEDKSEDGQKSGDQDGSETEQPGTEAQPEAATECAAGTDCKKE